MEIQYTDTFFGDQPCVRPLIRKLHKLLYRTLHSLSAHAWMWCPTGGGAPMSRGISTLPLPCARSSRRSLDGDLVLVHSLIGEESECRTEFVGHKGMSQMSMPRYHRHDNEFTSERSDLLCSHKWGNAQSPSNQTSTLLTISYAKNKGTVS